MKIIRHGNSKAFISTRGAFVSSLELEGVNVLKKARDGHVTHGGLSILAPFADIVSDAQYSWEGKLYRLPKNAIYENDYNDSIHGLVKNVRWNVKDEKKNSISLDFTLRHKGYPSQLFLIVKYALYKNTLLTEFEVKNIGDKKAPLICGAHPYFLFRDHWIIRPEEAVEHIMNPTSMNPLKGDKLCNLFSSEKNITYDDTYFGGGDLTMLSKDRVITIKRVNMPFFEIYNGKFSEGHSVAIEPMTGIPNGFNSKFKLETINPGETINCSFGIECEAIKN